MWKNYLSSIFIFLICAGSFLGVALKTTAIELNLDYPEFGGLDLNNQQDLAQLIAWLYYFIIGISGFAAFVMLVWGGIQWLTSAGNPSKTEDAKDRITSALLGLVIILASWLILNVINPDLTILRTPTTP